MEKLDTIPSETTKLIFCDNFPDKMEHLFSKVKSMEIFKYDKKFNISNEQGGDLGITQSIRRVVW